MRFNQRNILHIISTRSGTAQFLFVLFIERSGDGFYCSSRDDGPQVWSDATLWLAQVGRDGVLPFFTCNSTSLTSFQLLSLVVAIASACDNWPEPGMWFIRSVAWSSFIYFLISFLVHTFGLQKWNTGLSAATGGGAQLMFIPWAFIVRSFLV